MLKVINGLMIFIFFPIIYIYFVFLYGNHGVIGSLLVVLIAGIQLSLAVSMKMSGNVLRKNMKNAKEAQISLMQSLRRRGLASEVGVESGNIDILDMLKSYMAIIVFLLLGIMVYIDEFIFDANYLLRFLLANIFQYFMFLFALLGIFLNIFGRRL